MKNEEAEILSAICSLVRLLERRSNIKAGEPARWSEAALNPVEPIDMIEPIGGRDFDAATTTFFKTEAYARVAQGPIANVYICAAPSLKQLGRSLGLSLFKVGISDDPARRMLELARCGYGSSSRAIHAVEDDGFKAWALVKLNSGTLLSPNSPVTIAANFMSTRLPATLSTAAFDQALRAALAPAELGSWVRSRAGRAHALSCGVEPDACLRRTRRGSRQNVTLREAEELYAIRPRAELRRLGFILESIVIDHLASRTGEILIDRNGS